MPRRRTTCPRAAFRRAAETTYRTRPAHNLGATSTSRAGTAGGTLSSNIVNATTQYNIGGLRVLRTPAGTNSIFAGVDAGAANTTGSSNAFFGDSAGEQNLSGSWNAFIGYNAGFFNATGDHNAFFGTGAGFRNETGERNSFFGSSAGQYNTTGYRNTFIGQGAGNPNVSTQVNYSTAIGYSATVSTDHTIVLGTSAETTRVPGVFSVGSDNASTRGQINLLSPSGNANLYLQPAGVGYGINFGVSSSAPSATLYISQLDGTTYQDRLVINPSGTVAVNVLGAAGSTQLCHNASNEIAACSSSLRYKKDVARFRGGLDIVKRLRPISFTWKQGGMRDIGLGAEEVAVVDPLLVTHSASGEIEGVKYDIFFTSNLGFAQPIQPDISTLAVQVGGFSLAPESVGPVAGMAASYIVLRLPDLPPGNWPLSIRFLGVNSINSPTLSIVVPP